MKKEVDIGLVIAFVDNLLDKNEAKKVRSYIDNDSDWFSAYMDIKQASFEMESKDIEKELEGLGRDSIPIVESKSDFNWSPVLAIGTACVLTLINI